MREHSFEEDNSYKVAAGQCLLDQQALGIYYNLSSFLIVDCIETIAGKEYTEKEIEKNKL